MLFKMRNNARRLGVTLAMILTFVMLMGGQAFAAPTSSIDVYVGTTFEGTITTADIIGDSSYQANVLYSTYNNKNELRYYLADGALLANLLNNKLGITLTGTEIFTFNAGPSFNRVLSYSHLYASRNFYPCTGLPSSVGVRLAVQNTPPSTDCVTFDPKNNNNAIRLFFGQAGSNTDKNAPDMVSNITSIVIN
ncbi:MAG: hypothetical protein QM657_11675 [Lacrimispora sp.]|uniref:hypothetical protein n=1 Tax=Lacrimispora sp. TaxID=2719234 RepID=UPI0039E2E1C2